MEDNQEQCLDLVQKMHTDKMITDDQRDLLKDFVFDEDAILLSFFNRYSEPDEQEELREAVINYA